MLALTLERKLEKTEMVGAAGFEPATSRTPSVRATRLRHAPTAVQSWRECNTPPCPNQFEIFLPEGSLASISTVLAIG